MPTIPYKNSAGKRIRGTTTIIGNNLGWGKQPLIIWANKEGLEGRSYRESLQRAADAGTAAHSMIESDINGIPFDPSPYPPDILSKAENCFLNYLEWKDTVAFRPVHTELSLVSEEYQYGGTLDCVAEIKGRLALFDWKSSNGVHQEYLIQLGAYGHLWKETQGTDLTGYYLLRIEKEGGSWEFRYWQDVSIGFEVFKYLLALDGYKDRVKV